MQGLITSCHKVVLLLRIVMKLHCTRCSFSWLARQSLYASTVLVGRQCVCCRVITVHNAHVCTACHDFHSYVAEKLQAINYTVWAKEWVSTSPALPQDVCGSSVWKFEVNRTTRLGSWQIPPTRIKASWWPLCSQGFWMKAFHAGMSRVWWGSYALILSGQVSSLFIHSSVFRLSVIQTSCPYPAKLTQPHLFSLIWKSIFKKCFCKSKKFQILALHWMKSSGIIYYHERLLWQWQLG